MLAWSGAWLFIRERTRSGLETWIAREAAAGRRWSCGDRSLSGYPFRIEIRCGQFTLDRPDVHVSIGTLVFVSQVYQPRHIIAEASGPLRVEAGATKAEGTWRLLQASVALTDNGFERVSLVTDDPAVSIQSPEQDEFALSSRRFEAHLRPDPQTPSSYDLSLRSDGARIPGLDDMVGGDEPADITAGMDITEADDLPARPLWSELERWRNAGGRLRLGNLTMRKGRRRLEATGSLTVDAQHRPTGQLDIQAAALSGLLGRLTDATNLSGLIGALIGVPPTGGGGRGARGADAPLKPLPPLRIEGGRLLVGPIPVPGIRIPPLY